MGQVAMVCSQSEHDSRVIFDMIASSGARVGKWSAGVHDIDGGGRLVVKVVEDSASGVPHCEDCNLVWCHNTSRLIFIEASLLAYQKNGCSTLTKDGQILELWL